MSTYNINHTDSSKLPIEVEETEINDAYSIKFPGRIRLEWGKDVNESLLHLLENFAVKSSALDENEPDQSDSQGLLDNPVEGQLWFNKTNKRLYSYDKENTMWVPYGEKGQQYGANWGQIRHGEKLPLPVSPSGYVFSYEECIWSVSPHSYFSGFTNVSCYIESDSNTLRMQYNAPAFGIVDGIANYLIVGIQKNVNLGSTLI